MRKVCMIVCALVLVGCSSSGVPGSANPGVAGAWSGTGTRSDTGQSFTLNLSVTESGPSILATATFQGNLQAEGLSLTGSLSGNTLSLSSSTVQLSGTVAGTAFSGSGNALLQGGATLPFTFALTKGTGDPADPGIPGDPSTPTDPSVPTDPSTPGAPPDDGRCTYEVSADITVDSVMVDTPAACDYRVTGTFSVTNGTLTIEPGVTVRFTQDTSIWIDDAGSLNAVGTPGKRITFEAEAAVRGFAKGIYFRSGSYPSRIEYADLRYLGKKDTSYPETQNGAISGFGGGELALNNTTVMGSNFFGAELTRDDLVLTEFANNQFFDNAQEGLKISPEHLPLLDTASDYLGATVPNKEPYIRVGGFSAELAGEVRWPNVGAPYTFTNLYLEYGSTTVEPGVEIVLEQGGHFVIEYGGFSALGTPQQPIIFRGKRPGAGFWESIEFRESIATFEHVRVSDGGLSSIVSASSIDVDESSFSISNSSVSNSANDGIVCSGYSFSPADLTVGENVTFTNIEDENVRVYDDCTYSRP